MDFTLATRADINRLEASTKADLMEVKSDLRLEMAGIRGELSAIKWMMGVLIAVAVANFAKQFFYPLRSLLLASVKALTCRNFLQSIAGLVIWRL